MGQLYHLFLGRVKLAVWGQACWLTKKGKKAASFGKVFVHLQSPETRRPHEKTYFNIQHSSIY